MAKPLQQPPSPAVLRHVLVTTLPSVGILRPDDLPEIREEHRSDRASRQRGGESEALAALGSFVLERGEGYSASISSPSSAWGNCTRVSPYLTFGHLSLRQLWHALGAKQVEVRSLPKGTAGGWPRSLSAAKARLKWRSHFTQKLEDAPEMEHHCLCPAYEVLRTQPGDWNQAYYDAWAAGRTGYPMVDACMRSLIQHGWLNFRMRAMLVSFATYNLWLDWRGIAPHLPRLFLDYEPGIHYPQIQVQI